MGIKVGVRQTLRCAKGSAREDLAQVLLVRRAVPFSTAGGARIRHGQAVPSMPRRKLTRITSSREPSELLVVNHHVAAR
jgi:hypothetical protein